MISKNADALKKERWKKSEKNILPSGKKICMKKVIFIMKSKAFASVQKEKGGAYSIMQREGFFFLGERETGENLVGLSLSFLQFWKKGEK